MDGKSTILCTVLKKKLKIMKIVVENKDNVNFSSMVHVLEITGHQATLLHAAFACAGNGRKIEDRDVEVHPNGIPVSAQKVPRSAISNNIGMDHGCKPREIMKRPRGSKGGMLCELGMSPISPG